MNWKLISLAFVLIVASALVQTLGTDFVMGVLNYSLYGIGVLVFALGMGVVHQ